MKTWGWGSIAMGALSSRAVSQILLVIWLFVSMASMALAQSSPPPSRQWSEPERWAWEEIQAGRIADFGGRYGIELDPKSPDGWDDGRKLSSGFLKEILFREPYRSAIPIEGVRIGGAWFPDGRLGARAPGPSVVAQEMPLRRSGFLARS